MCFVIICSHNFCWLLFFFANAENIASPAHCFQQWADDDWPVTWLESKAIFPALEWAWHLLRLIQHNCCSWSQKNWRYKTAWKASGQKSTTGPKEGCFKLFFAILLRVGFTVTWQKFDKHQRFNFTVHTEVALPVISVVVLIYCGKGFKLISRRALLQYRIWWIFALMWWITLICQVFT